MNFYERINQEAFEAAFGGLTLEESVALILGDKPLSIQQMECLRLAASGGQYCLRFDPSPIGHIGFRVVASKGCGNYGWHILVPATPECRRRVNAERRRRWADYLFDAYGVERQLGKALFNECHGHEPTLVAASNMLDVAKGNKNFSNKTWRELGFRPGHPVEGRALAALRKLGLA